MPKAFGLLTTTREGWQVECLTCKGILYGDPLDIGTFPSPGAADAAWSAHMADHEPTPCPTCGHPQPAKIEDVGDYQGKTR